jgi:hydrogenase nickel incorporation protein HypA/HybF
MDEREVANHVVDLVDQAAYRNAVRRVVTVRLAIGGRRALDFERLQLTFDEVSRGTVADGARLVLELLSVLRHCLSCGEDFQATAADCPCPACGHPHTEARSGFEVRVLDMDVEDA